MINTLLAAMIAQLQADFTDAGSPLFVTGPVNPPTTNLPQIVLGPGKLELNQSFVDMAPGQMRPRETRDAFSVNTSSAVTIRGPYTISQSALEDTVSCRFNWKQAGDELEGKKQRICPRKNHQGDGFEINYATRAITVFYESPLEGTPTLEVEYSYPSVFTLREFQQTLSVDTFAINAADAERWAALATAAITTRTRQLLDSASENVNQHSAGVYAAHSLYNTFYLREGQMDRVGDSVFRYSLFFITTGQLILERTFTDNVEVIRKIFSPGHRSDAGAINIQANID